MSQIKAYSNILAYSGVFRHIQVYSGIIQAYSEPCVTLAYSEPKEYSEPCLTSTMERVVKIFKGSNYARSIFSMQGESNFIDLRAKQCTKYSRLVGRIIFFLQFLRSSFWKEEIIFSSNEEEKPVIVSLQPICSPS